MRNNVTSAQTFSHYFLADGLPNNLINSILEDDEHQLWLGTNGGLVKFDSKTIKSNLYNASDGMQSNEFSEHTCFKTADGEMFFGGMNGITSFYPQNLKTSSTKSEVTITDFYLFNEEVKPNIEIKGHIILKQPVFLTTQINLRPDENYFKLEFSAMNFNSPHKIKYAYKLEGYDKKWNITDANNRNATYTNLSHGDYTFLVKATNEDNLWSEAIRKINIHIATPFYLTWYAFLFYIISILLIMFYFTRYSIIRIATKQQIIHETEHNKVLHELDMIRTRFFINISHDLRTPLTLIVGPLEQILKDTNLPIEFKSQIGMVHRNGSKLKYLIEQLLDFRKQEAGKLIVNLRKVELNKFIKDEVDHFDFIIKEKGLDLLYDFKSMSFITSIDTEKTSKVIFNLLSNAVKYTMSGYIEITIDKTQQEDKKNRYIIISVKDTGIGIERSKLNHIFDRFYNSSDNAMDSSYGIGLSHCKDLVEVMNGKIEVESDLGNGSIFTVFLPISETLDNESISVEQIEFKNKTRQELEQRTETQSLGQKKLYTILVAEDNPEMRLYIKSCLINDYNVLEAENGADGFQLAMNKNPDLIISDYIMPIMNGMEFCKKIKTTLDTSHIPVILLTARADNELKLEGLENGADDYITKPFDIDYLRIKVMNLINNRENLRNLFQNSLVFEPTKITINSMDEKFLNTLKLEIEKGVPDFNFSIDSLEKTMAMSHSKFYSKVKSLTGLSCKELLQDFRLKRAAQIILESDFGVADISYMVGFSDPKYFTSCFKAKFNTTPTKYRISNDSPDKVME